MNRIFLYDGLKPYTNEVLSTVELFDATIYQFKEVKLRGDYKP